MKGRGSERDESRGFGSRVHTEVTGLTLVSSGPVLFPIKLERIEMGGPNPPAGLTWFPDCHLREVE